MENTIYELEGLSENPLEYEKNFDIIKKAINHCKANGFKVLKLPKGTFNIWNQKADDLRKALLSGEISATDDIRWHKERNIAFDCNGFDEFSIIGDDTHIIHNGLIGSFDFTNVNKVIIENITIDWQEPLYFTAEVKKIADNKITVLPEIKLNGGEPIVSFQNIDHKTGKQGGMCVFCGISNVKTEDNGLVSFTSEDTYGLSVGDKIIARYIYNFSPIIHFYCCDNVEVKNVTINSGCGMGVIAHKCGNLNFNKFRDIPSENRPMSTNTDATHFISCNGKISFKDCEFEGMGDDAVNVHGFYITIKKILDNRTVSAEIEATVQDGITDIPDNGDKVEFISRDTLLPFATGEIEWVKAIEDSKIMEIGFKEELPIDLNLGSVIGNTSKIAELTVENCFVRNIRGRAMLIQTRKALIKNNIFEGCTGQGVHIDTATGWWESIGTRDIEISNNKFIDCGYGITKYCDAVGIVVEVEAEKNVVGVHKNIVIKDNYIEGKNVGIALSCTDGLELSGNLFKGCSSEYKISNCKNVKIV